MFAKVTDCQALFMDLRVIMCYSIDEKLHFCRLFGGNFVKKEKKA